MTQIPTVFGALLVSCETSDNRKRFITFVAGIVSFWACHLSAIQTGLAAEILKTTDPKCFATLSGDIRANDIESVQQDPLVQTELQKPPRARLALCLESGGGSYKGGLNLARFVQMQGIGTRVAADRECKSACSLIFMSGTQRINPNTKEPNRTLHVRGKLGFHSPYINLPDADYGKGAIVKTYNSALGGLAELYDMETISASLIVTLANRGARKFFYITTVDDAGRWRISLSGARPLKRLTKRAARTGCYNEFGWSEDASSLLLDRRLHYPCNAEGISCSGYGIPQPGSGVVRSFTVGVEAYLGVNCTVQKLRDGGKTLSLWQTFDAPFINKKVPDWFFLDPRTPIRTLAMEKK